jgi:hypothetical protein
VLAGPQTLLATARTLAVSPHGDLHVSQFLTNGSFAVFPPQATGNTAPLRSVFTDTNDLTSIAVDADLHDFVLTVRPDFRVEVFPNGAVGPQPPSAEVAIRDPNLAALASIAVDQDEDLLIAGYQPDGQARIDTFDTGTTLGAQTTIVRSIVGAQTGLQAGSTSKFETSTLSIAVNRHTGELFVFNASAQGRPVLDQVSVFSARASGDVPPARVIAGPLTGIAGAGVLGTNKIAVAGNGELFVAEPNDTILVFASQASGNVAPRSRITDLTLGSGTADEGWIAVR